jgi:hypothetical protein
MAQALLQQHQQQAALQLDRRLARTVLLALRLSSLTRHRQIQDQSMLKLTQI